jgi:hypothetical protein
LSRQFRTETFALGQTLRASLEPGTFVLLGTSARQDRLRPGWPPASARSRRRVEPDVRADPALQGGTPLVHVISIASTRAAAVDDLGLEELASGAVVAIEWAERLPRRSKTYVSGIARPGKIAAESRSNGI